MSVKLEITYAYSLDDKYTGRPPQYRWRILKGEGLEEVISVDPETGLPYFEDLNLTEVFLKAIPIINASLP